MLAGGEENIPLVRVEVPGAETGVGIKFTQYCCRMADMKFNLIYYIIGCGHIQGYLRSPMWSSHFDQKGGQPYNQINNCMEPKLIDGTNTKPGPLTLFNPVKL